MTSPFEIFRIPVNLYRKTGGSYVNGIWVEGGETLIVITASIQPTTGEELMCEPEGRRNRKTYSLFTSTDVNIIAGGKNPDQVQIFGERYEVTRVEPWQNNPPVFGIVNHFKFYAQKLEALP
jgi:hypothetical protein